MACSCTAHWAALREIVLDHVWSNKINVLVPGKSRGIQPLMVSFKKHFPPWWNTPPKASFIAYKIQGLLLWQIPGHTIKQEALSWGEGRRVGQGVIHSAEELQVGSVLLGLSQARGGGGQAEGGGAWELPEVVQAVGPDHCTRGVDRGGVWRN